MSANSVMPADIFTIPHLGGGGKKKIRCNPQYGGL